MVRRMENKSSQLKTPNLQRVLTTSRPEDFCLDVIHALKRRKVTFRGLQPHELTLFLDGVIECWFQGNDKEGIFKRKMIRFMSYAEIKDAIHLGKPEVIAELLERLIDMNSARYF